MFILSINCLGYFLYDINKNKSKLEMNIHDFNVPKDYIFFSLWNLLKILIQN